MHMDFNVNTGYGYVLNSDGTFNYKYEQFMQGIHSFPDGCTVVEVADQATLDNTAAANPAPPTPTAAQLIAILDAQYQPQFSTLSSAYMLALLNNDTATMADVKSEYDALQTQYNTQKTGIENG